MKIVDVRITPEAGEPAAKPVADAIQTLSGGGSVSLELVTDEGVVGKTRVGFGRIEGAYKALAAVIESELKPVVVGRELWQNRRIYQEMLRETEYHGSFGITMFGIAAIDTAMWDCIGKAVGEPCWKLWGAVWERIPAYAMVAWMNYTDREVQHICSKAVKQGFRALKIKVGYPALKEDIHRIDVIREAAGPDVRLMVDANQVFNVAEALIRGRAYQEKGIYWFEEPLPADDLEGHAELAEKLDIPVATGENLYTPYDFARFLKRDAIDIVQADTRRAGGPTSLLQIGRLADAYRRPYASHGGGPEHLNVLACLPNAIYLETGLISEDSPLRLDDGCVAVPQGPGFSW